MTANRYVQLSRVASFFYLTAIFTIAGLAISLFAAIVSPMMEDFLARYGILAALIWAMLIVCGPSFLLAVAIGAFGKCPSCGERFVSLRGGARPRTSAVSRDVRRSLRVAFGYECRCEACSQDALALIRFACDRGRV